MQNDTIKTTWNVYITNVIPFYFLSLALSPTLDEFPWSLFCSQCWIISTDMEMRMCMPTCVCACNAHRFTSRSAHRSLLCMHQSQQFHSSFYLILCHFMMVSLSLSLSCSVQLCTWTQRVFFLNLSLLALCDSLVFLFSCTYIFLFRISRKSEKRKNNNSTPKKKCSCNVSKVVFVFDSHSPCCHHQK